MAAKFRKVDPRIWHDEKFSRLSSEDKLLALYCLTSGQTNRIGYYHLSIAMMAEQTGYPPDTLRKGIRRVCHTLKWCFDDASNVLFLPSWWKYNGACGPKTMAGNLQDLHDVPQSQLLEQFKAECRYLSEQEFDVLTRVCDTHDIPMPYPSAFGVQEQEQEQEKEQEQEQEKPPRRVVPKITPELPFSSERFKLIWAEWEQHRRDKKSPLTPTSVRRQLKTLSEWGEEKAIAAIECSIRNGWIGIFEDSDKRDSRWNGQAEARTEYAKRTLGGIL